ncbi:hypothetical protein GW7_01230 [Heterocephalus glaber]|uniref:Uncharacterized protein n=1 Tax=Heterocephalus glaber TaxID=10181 RepID=G5B0B6_HETGA|nr:hypothetical protein GW7_01230 [Heterocephalus glaber]
MNVGDKQLLSRGGQTSGVGLDFGPVPSWGKFCSLTRRPGVRTPSVPEREAAVPEDRGARHPPGRSPLRTGPTRPNNSSQWTRRVPEGEPAPDPISTDAAGSTQRSVTSASASSIIFPELSRAPRGPRCARPRASMRAALTQPSLRSGLAPGSALAQLT